MTVTFDLAPDWLDSLSDADDYAAAAFPGAAPVHRAAPLQAAAMLRAPAHPTVDQMAELVGELFAEGSLSFEQLCSLSHVPELESLLGDKVAHASPARRLIATRR